MHLARCIHITSPFPLSRSSCMSPQNPSLSLSLSLKSKIQQQKQEDNKIQKQEDCLHRKFQWSGIGVPDCPGLGCLRRVQMFEIAVVECKVIQTDKTGAIIENTNAFLLQLIDSIQTSGRRRKLAKALSKKG
ncbi:hypothetical protein O6H91_13G102200 [Diphasiastrum complanatum]|uniref:Uncharacterized protein n=1 Tax=Diphasiastrum complanatum TaxID=34168 RepID=A0ACC2BYZ7_DIPCM|nr:hypothetical protein O6H91_13G102200 [Diphasiastrum complanatum]